ncbi:MAG TPA: heat-inducible transcriptional repressor HrcA [Actinomycetota bacterium]|jgi:heat-inducible transcriptional repressor
MKAARELSDRKASILRALVRLYIRTGEPVGSEALASSAGLGVSSATIRNELASLEEMGYLTQPHTSAGRAPTDLAYRSYVDMLPARPRLRDSERKAIVHFFDEALADVDDILRGTTHLLSRLTRYASLALAPSQRETAIARAELVRLGTVTLLLVVFDTGQVDKRLIDLPAEATDDEVDGISRAMTDSFRGRTAAVARELAAERARRAEDPERAILSRVADALTSIDEAAEAEHVFLGGVANIAAEEAFNRRETLRQIYEALERESAVLVLLREAAANAPLGVMIGRENRMPEMWEASVVAAPFAAGGAIGSIGVVGPLRMDYGAAISAVRAVAERLSAAVEALSH